MEHILVENHHDGVTLLTINRPERRNAISQQTALELQAAFADFDRSDQRVAVLTGAGDKAFCTGADLKDGPPELWRCMPTIGVTTEKPVIAAVGGWCIGGGVVLAMMCDLLVASADARFLYPEGKVGGTGGIIAGLAGRIPHKAAMELMLLGRTMNARRAYEVGLANEIAPPGRHVDQALAMAREMTGLAPLVLKTLKRFVVQSVLPRGPAETLALISQDLEVNLKSADLQEGVAAFREKRSPKFTGR
jgi:enoyl-CoA hydratase/carnithine racemase